MLALGFRFDADAVIVDGTAHKTTCPLLAAALPADATPVVAGGTYCAQSCPCECDCAPPFETLLSHTADSVAALTIR